MRPAFPPVSFDAEARRHSRAIPSLPSESLRALRSCVVGLTMATSRAPLAAAGLPRPLHTSVSTRPPASVASADHSATSGVRTAAGFLYPERRQQESHREHGSFSTSPGPSRAEHVPSRLKGAHLGLQDRRPQGWAVWCRPNAPGSPEHWPVEMTTEK